MSLSARILMRPSRRLAVCETLAVVGGLVVAVGPLVARWPAGSWGIVAAACLCGALVLARRRPGSGATLVVSDRPEVGLLPTDAAADDGSTWRLAEGTMVWPGFCVVSLVSGRRRRRTLPVLDRDLTPDQRRALHRYLLWALRGGSGHRPAEA